MKNAIKREPCKLVCRWPNVSILFNKKPIITILLALVAVTGQAQEFTPVVEDSIDFVITGTTNTKVDTVTWWQCAPYPQGVSKNYFVPVKDGRFCVEGRLPRHIFIQIGDDEGNDLHFIVEETPTHINFVTGEVTGSEIQCRFIKIQQREQEIEKAIWGDLTEDEQMIVIQMVGGEIPIATVEDSLHVRCYNEGWERIDSLRLKCYRENLDNYLPAYYLYVNHMNLPLDELETFMREDSPYAHHPAMRHVWKQYWGLQKKRSIQGNSFIDFEAEAPAGTKHHLSEYAGKGQYVLIDFWASWCGPCIGSFPMMKQLHEAYGSRGLRIVGISIDQSSNDWHKALDKHRLPWLQLRETTGTQTNKTSASNLYGITSVPTLVLIAPDGRVISTDLKKKELKAKLEEIFPDKK